MSADGGNGDDDRDEHEDSDGTESASANQPVRGRRRNIDLERDVVLDDHLAYSVPQLHHQSIDLTLKASGITKTGGRPAVVANLIAKFEKFYEALGGDAWMTELQFGNSVTVTLRPVIDDRVREEAARIAEKEPDREYDSIERRHFVPDSIVAASSIVTILESSADEGLNLASRYGTGAAAAYVQFAKAIDEADGSARLRAPGRPEDATWTFRKAKRVVERAKDTDAEDPFSLLVVGRLTRADSEEQELRVVLDRDAMRKESRLDGRRRVVEGSYSARVLRQVQENGLWDSDVVAKVTAYPVRKTGKAKATIEEFTFTDVRKAP